ncbi:MAG: hypothetical protein EAZ67_04385 [Cytophagales bacterium]|nr:MAG: hypothetical protein EAZ67_04385 [Cytophagales bacterium]
MNKHNIWLWSVGVLLLLVAASMHSCASKLKDQETLDPLKYERTIGSVIDLAKDERQRYYPVILFFKPDSQKVYYKAKREADLKPRYKVGDVIHLQYDLINTDDVFLIKDKSFEISFLRIAGSVLLLLGLGIVGSEWLRIYRIRQLMKHGIKIITAYHSVGIEPAHKWFGGVRYVVYTKSEHETGGLKDMSYRSHTLAYDPSPRLTTGRPVSVYVNAKNPEYYYVDINFLER